MSDVTTEWDYVVVGGGSAGCALANRLSADGRHRVLVLEAGRADRHPLLHVPGLTQKALRIPGVISAYRAEPDPTRGDARSPWITGHVLGGGSSVNGVVWVRGNPTDFDRWAELGCDGWDWAGVEPYFRRAETFAGGGTERGTAGPIHVRHVPARHVITDAFVQAADAAGYPFTEDYNGARQEGVGYGQANVRHGLRHSAARAYLGRARWRRNLRVVTNATVERVVFDGTRAVGVAYRHRGRQVVAHVRREVVLSAGAIASPQLLMLSGVGPGHQLREHGIDVVADAPGVGANLQEHPVVPLLFNVDVPTFGMELNARGYMRHGLGLLLGRGPAASGIFHAILFSKLDANCPRPEIEVGFTPVAVVGAGIANTKAETLEGADTHDLTKIQILDRATVTAYVTLLHPRSRGAVVLQSPDPTVAPAIRHQMFADERDMWDLVAGCRQLRSVFDTSPMHQHVMSEARPGRTVKSDDEWERYVRSTNSHGASHPIGTCRMGKDEGAVVDPQLRVRGVEGLRVADASVMPELTSGNTNAPAIMIGEKAADLVLAG